MSIKAFEVFLSKVVFFCFFNLICYKLVAAAVGCFNIFRTSGS